MKKNDNSYNPITPFREVLAISAFRHLWFGQFASQLAHNTLLFVLGLHVYELTGSNTAVSVLFLVYGLAALLFGMAGGTLVDKFDKRLVMLLCDFIRAIFILAFYVFSNHIIAIYVVTFINAVITQLYIPAEASTIPRLVPKHQLVTAISLFSFTFFTSLALGSIFSGPFLRLFGDTGIYFSLSLLFFIAGINIWSVPKDTKSSGIMLRLGSMSYAYILNRVLANTWEGIQYAYNSKDLRTALFLLTGTQIILALLGTLGPGFADRILQIDIRDSSFIITGPVVVGIICGALWVGSVGSRFTSRWLMEKGILSSGLLLVGISILVRLKRIPALSGFSNDGVLLVLILILFFLLGVANSLLDVPANSMLQRKARGAMRGRVYGILTAFIGGVGLLPVILGGILADFMGVGKVILAMGILITACGIFFVRYNKKQKLLATS